MTNINDNENENENENENDLKKVFLIYLQNFCSI